MASGMSPISSRKSVPPSAARRGPWRVAVAPVKAPFTWPKSSLSSSVSGSARAVDRHEGAGGPRAALVDRARHELLAGAALAEDEHRGVRRRDALDEAQHGAHRRPVADDVREAARHVEAPLQHAVAALEATLLDGPLQARPHLVPVGERLDEVVERAALHRRDRGVDRRVAGHQHHREVGVVPAQQREEREPVGRRHVEVRQHHVEAVGLARREGQQRLRGVEHEPVEAQQAEHAIEHAEHRRLVVHDGHGGPIRRRAHGPALYRVALSPRRRFEDRRRCHPRARTPNSQRDLRLRCAPRRRACRVPPRDKDCAARWPGD